MSTYQNAPNDRMRYGLSTLNINKINENCIFFYTMTWLPPPGFQTSPSQGVATGQKLEKKLYIINYSYSHSDTHLLIHSLVFQKR